MFHADTTTLRKLAGRLNIARTADILNGSEKEAVYAAMQNGRPRSQSQQSIQVTDATQCNYVVE
jgi:hypothetical protein